MPLNIGGTNITSIGVKVLNDTSPITGSAAYIDAGIAASYPGSGTTWTDLSGNGNSGTLVNGPTFTTGSGGAIVFDGVDDYCINSISTGFTAAMTIITIAKSNNSTWTHYAGLGSARYNNGYIIHNNISSTSVSNYLLDSSGNYTQVGFFTPSNIQNFNFYALTTNGSNSHRSYLNGIQVDFSNASITRTNTGSSQSNYLALDSTIGGRYTAMSIASHFIYNRELSAAEILQNFQSQRQRFGI